MYKNPTSQDAQIGAAENGNSHNWKGGALHLPQNVCTPAKSDQFILIICAKFENSLFVIGYASMNRTDVAIFLLSLLG